MSSIIRVAASAASYDSRVALCRSFSSIKRLSMSPETPMPGTEAYKNAMRNLENVQKTKRIAEEASVRSSHVQAVDQKGLGQVLEELDALSIQIQRVKEHVAALDKTRHSHPN